MTNEERRKAAEWFRKRAKECPMPATRQMYKIATEALETPPNDNWEGYSSRLWKNAYERGKADAEQTRWIPVTERLPEEWNSVLITFSGKYGNLTAVHAVGTGSLDGINGWYFDEIDGYTERLKVEAWMPLPEPYKAESEDKA